MVWGSGPRGARSGGSGAGSGGGGALATGGAGGAAVSPFMSTAAPIPSPTTSTATIAIAAPGDDFFRTTSGRRDIEGAGAFGSFGNSGTVQTFWQREQTAFAPATAFASLRMLPHVQQIVWDAMASNGSNLDVQPQPSVL